MERMLVLTVDHEVFGDGSGDVRKHVCSPAWRMAGVCQRFNMPLTVFFEVEEYLAFREGAGELVSAWGYDAAREMREQAIELARRGHDLQLHLHPEWVGARFTDGNWQLRPWQQTVEGLFEFQEPMDDYIRSRVSVVAGFRREAGVDARVLAFRAGGFRAQPGRMLLEALARNGVMIESSVVKGMVTRGVAGCVDYSRVPELRRHWRICGDVAPEDPGGRLVEIPVYSRMGRRLQQFTPRRMAAKFSADVPARRQRAMIRELGIRGTPGGLLRFLWSRFPIKLDYHNMSSGQILRWIRGAEPPPEGDLDVMVLIGHTKEHRDDAAFARLLEAIAGERSLRVVSMSEVAGLIEKLEVKRGWGTL